MGFIKKIIKKGIRTIKRSLSWIKEWLTDLGILYPSYQQSLMKRRISKKLIQYYDCDHGHQPNFTQYFLGFGLIHYAFVRNLKPDRVLCIGSRKGFIPAILALACKDNGRGVVDFVDAAFDEDQPSKNWSGVGFWRKVDPDAHFSHIGVDKYITTYVMTTEKFAKTYPKRRYQYIYIDGDHSYKGALLDYRLFWPKLDKWGYMSFHDILPKGKLDEGVFGVWKLWERIGKHHAVMIPFPADSGLGIVQKV